ncbi:hypothetical protein KR038_010594, partial [Drosophila bunnanda]
AMAFRIYPVLLLLLHLSQAIKVQDGAPSSSTVSPTVYRVSKPEPKHPENRVPAHLQDIRPGYVDDDAGDVIRIIEPPQHFQQLKRLRHRQPGASPVIWEQPRKLVTNRAKVVPPGDLLTQETQLQNHLNSPNQLQIPVEILASVRKTERLLQRQRQKGPLVRQRHIQRQSHTLISQKSLEQQLYHRGQQHKLRAMLSRNQEHKRNKRVKRATGLPERETPGVVDRKRQGKAAYDVAQGLKLVAHIGDLLSNASLYLPDEGATNEVTPFPKRSPLQQQCSNATNCDSRRRRQRLFKHQPKPTEREKFKERRRHFRNEATTTTTEATTTTTTGKSPPVIVPSASATPLASRLVNSRKSKTKSPNNHLARSDDSILYADVMTNIRNLWQEHDLLAAPRSIAPGEVANNTDYRALDVYLKELDHLAKKLPTVAPITGLNQEELERATPTPSWYLINEEGKIYETRLDSQTKPSSALFHRFPDMPENKQNASTLVWE